MLEHGIQLHLHLLRLFYPVFVRVSGEHGGALLGTVGGPARRSAAAPRAATGEPFQARNGLIQVFALLPQLGKSFG